jgi:hypothetical protein
VLPDGLVALTASHHTTGNEFTRFLLLRFVSEFHHFAIVFDDCAQGNDIRPQHLPNQGSFTIRKMEDFDDDLRTASVA